MARPPMQNKGKGRAKEILRAEVSDIRQIATILKTVDIKPETKATVTVQSDGLSFNVEVGQTVLARAHLHYQTNFRSYAYNPPAHIIRESNKLKESRKARRRQERDSSATEASDEEDEDAVARGNSKGRKDDDEDDVPPPMTFEISLSALLNCLNIFGDTTVKPISARAQANRERWKQRQQQRNGNGNGNGGPQYGRRSSRFGNQEDDDDDDDESGGPELRDEALFQRDSARAGGAVAAGRKKANVAMVLTWQEEGCPLVLLLEDNGIVTRCEITTFDASEIFDLPYDDDERAQKLILNSSWLSEALSEIDSSCERLTLRFRPPRMADGSYHTMTEDTVDDDDSTANGDASTSTYVSKAAFSLEAQSNSGSVEMDYPFTREVLEVCECERSIRNGYKFSHISFIKHALSYSTKTSLRTDSSGILSMQFMIVNASAPKGDETVGAGFVEFTCMPLNEED